MFPDPVEMPVAVLSGHVPIGEPGAGRERVLRAVQARDDSNVIVGRRRGDGVQKQRVERAVERQRTSTLEAPGSCQATRHEQADTLPHHGAAREERDVRGRAGFGNRGDLDGRVRGLERVRHDERHDVAPPRGAWSARNQRHHRSGAPKLHRGERRRYPEGFQHLRVGEGQGTSGAGRVGQVKPVHRVAGLCPRTAMTADQPRVAEIQPGVVHPIDDRKRIHRFHERPQRTRRWQLAERHVSQARPAWQPVRVRLARLQRSSGRRRRDGECGCPGRSLSVCRRLGPRERHDRSDEQRQNNDDEAGHTRRSQHSAPPVGCSGRTRRR